MMLRVQATVPILWLMPVLQLLLLLFFTTVAISHWIYSWVLLLPCLITGQPEPFQQLAYTVLTLFSVCSCCLLDCLCFCCLLTFTAGTTCSHVLLTLLAVLRDHVLTFHCLLV